MSYLIRRQAWSWVLRREGRSWPGAPAPPEGRWRGGGAPTTRRRQAWAVAWASGEPPQCHSHWPSFWRRLRTTWSHLWHHSLSCSCRSTTGRSQMSLMTPWSTITQGTLLCCQWLFSALSYKMCENTTHIELLAPQDDRAWETPLGVFLHCVKSDPVRLLESLKPKTMKKKSNVWLFWRASLPQTSWKLFKLNVSLQHWLLGLWNGTKRRKNVFFFPSTACSLLNRKESQQ